jgi:hypothetical protein
MRKQAFGTESGLTFRREIELEDSELNNTRGLIVILRMFGSSCSW